MTDKKSSENNFLIIFTDLDGTLLDSGYSFEKALPALEKISEKHIPLIMCSSKTRTEIELYKRKLGNEHPFISENGGGIFVPADYFKLNLPAAGYLTEKKEKYHVIKLGEDYSVLRSALKKLRAEGFNVKGFGDMTAGEVAGLTGLAESDAEMAKDREFDETFVFEGDAASEESLVKRIKAEGFNYTRGEYFHIMGNSDKGRAFEILKSIYQQERQNVITAALGDSMNDIEMLQRADYAFVVGKEDGTYNQGILSNVKDCIKAEGSGPEGWNIAVLKLVEKLGL